MARLVGSGEDCVCRESGVRRSILFWCVWQDCYFCSRECVFTYNFIYIFFFTFDAICEDGSAIKCIYYCSTQYRYVPVRFETLLIKYLFYVFLSPMPPILNY